MESNTEFVQFKAQLDSKEMYTLTIFLFGRENHRVLKPIEGYKCCLIYFKWYTSKHWEQFIFILSLNIFRFFSITVFDSQQLPCKLDTVIIMQVILRELSGNC